MIARRELYEKFKATDQIIKAKNFIQLKKSSTTCFTFTTPYKVKQKIT